MAISVADTGLGISQLNMARLFEPLFTTKSRGYNKVASDNLSDFCWCAGEGLALFLFLK